MQKIYKTLIVSIFFNLFNIAFAMQDKKVKEKPQRNNPNHLHDFTQKNLAQMEEVATTTPINPEITVYFKGKTFVFKNNELVEQNTDIPNEENGKKV